MYFTKFPEVKYKNDIVLKNLMVRISLKDSIFKKKNVFYPYIIEDWERPDTIAADYYGDSNYYWIVLFSNHIIDPHFQWYLNENQFNAFIKKKYNSTIPEIMQLILHYEYKGLDNETKEQISRKNWKLPKETYDLLTDLEEKNKWVPVYAYDYERKLNDKRKEIKLLDVRYLNQAEEEMEMLLNG